MSAPAPGEAHGKLRFRWTAAHWVRMLGVAAAIGVLGGLAAAGIEWGLHHLVAHAVGRFMHLGGPRMLAFRFEILVLPAVGGLASSLIWRLVPRDRNGGTEALVRAFHRHGGRMPLGSPALKALANVAVVGCGGSTGPEGPIAGLGAAIGSKVGGLLGVHARERRMFLLAGCSACVSALFRCPLGGALFATTILYREPENEDAALMPCIVSAVTGYATYMTFWGRGHPLLEGAGKLGFTHPVELLAYMLLAVLAAGAGALLYYSFKAVERLELETRVPHWAAPILGGLVVGAIACAVPQVMDARYRFVQNALDGSLFAAVPRAPLAWVAVFALVIVAKCVATAFTVGTGNMGGTLAPTVFIGGVVGAATGSLLTAVFPGTFPEGVREALIPVGVAAMLAVSMRVPLAASVMVLEITGSYGLIVPLIFVTVIAYALGRRFGLNHEQLGAPEDSPAHAGRPLLSLIESVHAEDVMERVPAGAGGEPAVPASADLRTALSLFRQHGVEALRVVSRRGEPLGRLRRSTVYEMLRRRVAEQRAQLLEENVELAALDQERQVDDLLTRLPAAGKVAVDRIPAPADLVGKSLRQSGFRERHGGQVVAIQTGAGDVLAPPDPARPLAADDVLVVVRVGTAPPPAAPAPATG